MSWCSRASIEAILSSIEDHRKDPPPAGNPHFVITGTIQRGSVGLRGPRTPAIPQTVITQRPRRTYGATHLACGICGTVKAARGLARVSRRFSSSRFGSGHDTVPACGG